MAAIRQKAKTLFGVLMAALGTVGGCAESQGVVDHPTSDNLPRERNIQSGSEPIGMTTSALAEWRETRATFSSARTVATIGVLGAEAPADDPYVFGDIADVALDREGKVYVLDRQYRQVRIFDSHGTFLEAFGSAGSGPNEFFDPTGIELMSMDRVAVSDRGAQLKVFAPTDNGYEHQATVPFPLVPEGLCSNSTRVFVAGWNATTNTIVHEVPVDSAHSSNSFGAGYRSDSWLVQDQFSDGRIACVGSPLRVVFAFEHLPVLRMYLANSGELAWTTRVGGYAQINITELVSSDRGSSVRFPAEGVRDALANLADVSSRHVLLQYYRGEPASFREGTSQLSVRSYLIDAETGHGALISDSLPLIAATAFGYQVAMWMLPFPKLETRTNLSKEGGG